MPYADPQFTATIVANGQRYSAWKSVMVRRDFGNGVSVFQFEAAEGSYGANYSALKLNKGDPVQIFLGGEQVLDGRVKHRAGAYGEADHQLVIGGRSKTADLKDSSVVVQPGTYNGSTFEQAARGVMGPHPVQLMMMNPPDIASKPFETLSVQYGETVAEFVSRTAAMRGLFITDDENGNLVAGQGDPSMASIAELVEGRNIKRCQFTLEDPTAAIYEGSSQQPGNDSNWPSRANAASLNIGDEARSNLYRLFISEHPADAEELAARVNHEAVQTLWPTISINVTVVGWRRPDGKLWKPAPFGPANVSFFSPMVFPDETSARMLGIQSVTYTQDDQNGTETTLGLVRPDLLTHAPTSGIGDITPGAGGQPQTATPEQPN